MPVTPSAKKAMRRDRRRENVNKPIRTKMQSVLRRAREETSPENISAAYSAIDRAAKKHVVHKNKAARLKSRIKVTPKKPV